MRNDQELGMYRPICRRDFLHGLGLAAGGTLIPTGAYAAAADPDYPPTRTGMRGSHDGSFEVAHALRDGSRWNAAETGEHYDLVVVGGGISGLSAAYFYRKAMGNSARVLILDNHDDFGGHAKRNEFWHDGRMLLCNGGTLNVEAPSQYSEVAAGLLTELGIDRTRYYQSVEPIRSHMQAMKLERAMFFKREAYGEDTLVKGLGSRPWPEFLADTPFSRRARKDLARLHADEQPDYLPGFSSAEKKAHCAKTSYRDFLINDAKVDPAAVAFFDERPKGLFATGVDAVPALYAWEMAYPGFQGMALEPTPPARLIDEPGGAHGRESEARATAGDRDVYFPDGNATIARLLVARLCPDVVKASGMEDVVTARVRYDRLDREGARVRVRLSSTVVNVAHAAVGDGVHIDYVRGTVAKRVRADAVVLACWHAVVPYICPELPEAQKAALLDGEKAPIVYTSVLVSNWRAFTKIGISAVEVPGGYHSSARLAIALSLGDYATSTDPGAPAIIQMGRYPCQPGLTRREQHRAGRRDLLTTSFETFERHVRDELGRMLDGGGFDPARDIRAITVNRWPHGYTYTYNTLYDPQAWALTNSSNRPVVRARQPLGRIAIANADAAASPHTDAAINEAHRAIQEVSARLQTG